MIDVCTSRQGTGTLLWCPSHCNVAVTEVHMPPTYTHPPPLPFLSALSTPNTKDQHLFLLLRRNHSFRRIQDSWPPGPFRCPVCVCTCLSAFICVLVDLFCPPPPTTTTGLTIPRRLCPSSPWAMLTGARPFSGPSLPFCLPVIATRSIVLSIGAESSG